MVGLAMSDYPLSRKKIIVFKKKRRKGYHKKQGHRQFFTGLKIKEINA